MVEKLFLINFLKGAPLKVLPSFRSFRKITKSDYYFVTYVCLSVRPSACNNSPLNGGSFVKFDM